MALTRESTVIYSTPAGKFAPYGGGSVPTGWLLCDGTAVSRSTYAILFASIGTAYGVGDGSTTFNLPDCRTKVVPGYKSGDANFGTLGGAGGAASVTLSSAQIPAHQHTGTTGIENVDHTHSGTTNLAGAHSHGIHTIQSPGSFVDFGFSNIAGSSQIAINTDAAADHTHGFTSGGRSAVHFHQFTSDNNTGGGGSHTNLQPFVTANYIIKY